MAKKDYEVFAKRMADRLLRAKDFIDQSNSESGGATANANTMRLVQPGREMYIVGKEPTAPNKKGKAKSIPTTYVPQKGLHPMRVVQEAAKIVKKTKGRPTVNIGSWKNEGKFELDASRGYPTEKEAMGLADDRNEIAIWDNKNEKPINNPNYKPKK
jgi:hypothetical protein